jgi:hypothetical protein
MRGVTCVNISSHLPIIGAPKGRSTICGQTRRFEYASIISDHVPMSDIFTVRRHGSKASPRQREWADKQGCA